MAKKNIAFVVKYFPTVSETFIVNQINALIERGHNVTLFSYHQTETKVIHQSLLKHDLVSKVKYFEKPSSSKFLRLNSMIKWLFKHRGQFNWSLFFKSINSFAYGKEAYSLKLFYEMQWFLIQNNFDIIHAHFGVNANRIAYLKQTKLLPKTTKLVTTFHGYDLVPHQEAYYREHYKHIFQFSNAITVNTKYMYELLKSIDKNLDSIFILPVGTDTTYFKPRPRREPNSHFQITFCGKLIPLKGPDLAVKIVKQLHELGHKVILNIIGDGPMFNEIKILIEDLELTKYVLIHGAITQEDIKSILNNSDVFLLPGRKDPKTARAETQGLVIQEAQAMALPVVVSDVGGMKYGLIDGETGFVVKENAIQDFVSVIEKLIANSDLKLETGKKGRVFVEKNYDNKILVQHLEQIYDDLN